MKVKKLIDRLLESPFITHGDKPKSRWVEIGISRTGDVAVDFRHLLSLHTNTYYFKSDSPEAARLTKLAGGRTSWVDVSQLKEDPFFAPILQREERHTVYTPSEVEGDEDAFDLSGLTLVDFVDKFPYATTYRLSPFKHQRIDYLGYTRFVVKLGNEDIPSWNDDYLVDVPNDHADEFRRTVARLQARGGLKAGD